MNVRKPASALLLIALLAVPLVPAQVPANAQDPDNDGAATVTEAQVGSHPLRYASQPGSDDDGDGKVNAYEVLNEYEVLPLQCTGAYGYIRSSVCNGYEEPSGHTGNNRYVESVWRDNAGFVWVFDSICLPAALNGDYTTCKNTGNRALSSTTYKGDWTSDGYGWRHVDASSAGSVTIPTFAACGTSDSDGDSIPTIHVCTRTLTIHPDGTTQQGPPEPWMNLGDDNRAGSALKPGLPMVAAPMPATDTKGYIVIPYGQQPLVRAVPAPDVGGKVAILFFLTDLPTSSSTVATLRAFDLLGNILYDQTRAVYFDRDQTTAALVYFQAIPTQGAASLQFSYGDLQQDVDVERPDRLGDVPDDFCLDCADPCATVSVPVVCGPVPPPPPPCQQPVVKDVPPCRPVPPPPPPCEQPVVRDVPPCKPVGPLPCVTVPCICASVPSTFNVYPCGGTPPCSPPASCIPPVGCPDGTVDCYVCLDETTSAQASAITNCMPTVPCSDLSCIDNIDLLNCGDEGLIQCLIGDGLPCETNLGAASPTASCLDGLPCTNAEDNCLDPGPICEDGCIPEHDIDPPSCDNSMDAQPNARIGCGVPIAPPTCATSTRAPPAIGCGITISSGACEAPTCYEIDLPLTMSPAAQDGNGCRVTVGPEGNMQFPARYEQNLTDQQGRRLNVIDYATIGWAALIGYKHTCIPEYNGGGVYALGVQWAGPQDLPVGNPATIYSNFLYHGASIKCVDNQGSNKYARCEPNSGIEVWTRPDSRAFVPPDSGAHFTFEGKPRVYSNGKERQPDECSTLAQAGVFAGAVALGILGPAGWVGLGIAVGQELLDPWVEDVACSMRQWSEMKTQLPNGEIIGNGVDIAKNNYDEAISMRNERKVFSKYDVFIAECPQEPSIEFVTFSRLEWSATANVGRLRDSTDIRWEGGETEQTRPLSC